MAGSLTVSCNSEISESSDNLSHISDDTGSNTEHEGDDDEDDDIDLNSDVVAALLDGNSLDGQGDDDGNDSWEDLDIQEENL